MWAQFGPLDVSCEGWKNKHDSYVVKGSCALRYELVSPNERAESSWFSSIFMIFFFLITCAIVVSFLESCFSRAGSKDCDAPPPPYSAAENKSWLAGGLAAVGLTSLAASLQARRSQQAQYPAYGAMYNPALDSHRYGTFDSHGPTMHTSTGFGGTDNR